MNHSTSLRRTTIRSAVARGQRDGVRIACGVFTLMLILSLAAVAGGKETIQNYVSDAATRVKAASNPSEKRQILSETFSTMNTVFETVKQSSTLSTADLAGINRLQSSIRENQDELSGQNGYVRVPDEKLNAFSEYAVQDLEQADQVVTISLVTLLLIAILFVLLVK